MCSCIAPGCKSVLVKYQKAEMMENGYPISFHGFPGVKSGSKCPKKKELCEKWIAAVFNREGWPPPNSKNMFVICSLHFLPEEIYRLSSTAQLRDNVVPSIFHHFAPTLKEWNQARRRAGLEYVKNPRTCSPAPEEKTEESDDQCLTFTKHSYSAVDLPAPQFLQQAPELSYGSSTAIKQGYEPPVCHIENIYSCTNPEQNVEQIPNHNSENATFPTHASNCISYVQQVTSKGPNLIPCYTIPYTTQAVHPNTSVKTLAHAISITSSAIPVISTTKTTNMNNSVNIALNPNTLHQTTAHCMCCRLRITDNTDISMNAASNCNNSNIPQHVQPPCFPAPHHNCGRDPLCFICRSGDTPNEVKLKEQIRLEEVKHEKTKKVLLQLRKKLKILNQKVRRKNISIQKYHKMVVTLHYALCLDPADQEMMLE